jgi:hypothetical protein
MSKYLVVEYPGQYAWSEFEKGISNILGENEAGSGFSFATGERDISASFKTEQDLNSAKEKVEQFAKSKGVRVYMTVSEEDEY